VIKEYSITGGLSFQLKPLETVLNNTSFLQRNREGILLTYIFSGADVSLPITHPALGYQLIFSFQNQFLETFADVGEEFSLHHFPDDSQHDLCCTTQMILHEVVQCKLQGAFRNMFIQSKALELLLCSQKYTNTDSASCASCKFLTKPIEKEKITRAKEILLSSLQNPPTFPELSLLIGI
jgi:hypothetical protein